MQAPVAAEGQARFGSELFNCPDLPLIDGRGAIWHPKSTNSASLRDYTLGHQIIEPYDFTTAIQVAACEFMPDVFIVLGPGTTLGGATAQSLLAANWRGLRNKTDFKVAQESNCPRLISMGMPTQRARIAI